MGIVSHYWGSLKIPLTLENHLIFHRRYHLDSWLEFSSNRHVFVNSGGGGGYKFQQKVFGVGFGAFF